MTTPFTEEEVRLQDVAVELRVLVGQFRRKLREQGGPGVLTPSQMSVLGRLERDGPATVTMLAQVEGVRPQSMGATVSALQLAGMIEGLPHPTDGRQTLLRTTPKCKEFIKNFRAAREDWLMRSMQAKLSVAEQKKLGEALGLLRRLLEN